MTIRRALEHEAPALSRLAREAKAHWGYARRDLDAWKPLLTISAEQVRNHPTYVATIGDRIAGFVSLAPSGAAWDLDNLWVSPESMHRGIGRALLAHALAVAAQAGATEVTVDSDPHAEGFYLTCGAVRRGEVPAPILGEPERIRPQLSFPTC